MSFEKLAGWLGSVGSGNAPSITQEEFLAALVELGLPAGVSLGTAKSLSAYTWSKRQLGLTLVLGEKRLAEFQSFVDRMADEYGDLLQPTEAGGTKIGLRRLFWDIIAFGYGCMEPLAFRAHVSLAAENGAIYAKEHKVTEDMEKVLSPVDNEWHLPASFPPGYPDKMAEFLRGWL